MQAIVPLFLEFINTEYNRIYQPDDEDSSAAKESAEDSQAVVAPETLSRLDTYRLHLKLEAYLKVFSKQSNPRHLLHSSTLWDLFHRCVHRVCFVIVFWAFSLLHSTSCQYWVVEQETLSRLDTYRLLLKSGAYLKFFLKQLNPREHLLCLSTLSDFLHRCVVFALQ